MAQNSTGPLLDFKNYYLSVICPYPNFISSGIGSVLNILNIVVFTRKSMASPMTTIFLHLSIVDLAVLLINIPLTWHVCIDHNSNHQHVYSWEVFHFIGRYVTTLLFYTSVWFTVMLAKWRYSAFVYPLKERRWSNKKNTRIALIAGYIFGTVLTLPLYLSLHIQPSNHHGNTTTYTIEYHETSAWYFIHFILFGTTLKLIPSVVLSVLSYK